MENEFADIFHFSFSIFHFPFLPLTLRSMSCPRAKVNRVAIV